MNKAFIEIEKCIGCGECIDACPRGCIELIDGKAQISEEDCVGCMACERVCTENAIIQVVEAEIIGDPDQGEDRTRIKRSKSAPLIKSSTVKKVGKFLLNSSLALLTSPRVWRAIFGEKGSYRRQDRTEGISNYGRGPGKGRGQNRRRRRKSI